MTSEASAKPKTGYYYKLFRVRRSDGRVTTVSMDPALVALACRSMGSLKAVSTHVRNAAFQYEDGQGQNCSRFVSTSLRQAIDGQRSAARAEMAA